ncbi:MAG TPA: undecaprenyl diphosphate synthase family protein [Burkholderiales bacterium]|nr:undecaprenyl diphosphate synthase family protein [Burkholderiales bacterium]
MDRALKRLPRHVGIIPDGNRRWAQGRGRAKGDGYEAGIAPGLRMLRFCRELGIEELSVYGFTKENVRRPSDQVHAFSAACVALACRAVEEGAALRVIGDTRSPVFPRELLSFAQARTPGAPRLNLLANYGWQWDVAGLPRGLRSADASRVDLVVRWGGRRRLSGFLPIQCAYADFYVIDTLWPDMREEELVDALVWYESQDVTLGG